MPLCHYNVQQPTTLIEEGTSNISTVLSTFTRSSLYLCLCWAISTHHG